MGLPRLPNREGAVKREIVEFRGMNLSDRAAEGEFSACENLSSRRYPYLSQRLRRVAMGDYKAPTAIAAWGKLIVVDGTDLYYGDKVVGQVAAGEKQFAVVGTKLIVWPDKKYLDMEGLKFGDLGAKVITGASSVTFATDSLTVTGLGETKLTDLFTAGDGITISGCTSQAGNNKDIVIKKVEDTKITVSANGFAAGSEAAAVTMERKIPDLDFICESENRLWGCSNAKRTIYASSLGDPKNFFVYEGLATDAYALAVGSEGDFTGCCKLSTAVLFWKENCLHKMLGSFPAEYGLYTSNISGLQAGGHKSLQVINEMLFYKGTHGVYAYSGGAPTLISDCFGAHDFQDAVAGTDGNDYFLSVQEGGAASLLVYDTRRNSWLREDDTRAVDFARMGKFLYILADDGSVWAQAADAGEELVPWSARLAPFYETVQGRKRYSRVLLRLELEAGSWVKAEVRCDGGPWQEAGKVVGAKQDVTVLRVMPRRCDKFELRLSGEGSCAVLSMIREFKVGSEV